MNDLDFQNLIWAMLDEKGCETKEELERFSDNLHQQLEIAFEDYADELEIDYDANY